MSNPLTIVQRISHTPHKPTAAPVHRRILSRVFHRFNRVESRFIASFVLGLTLWCAGGHSPSGVQAASPETAPAELKNLVQQIDAAANREDVAAVMKFYAQNFSNSDGLTRPSLEQALIQLWERYDRLDYRTEIESWEADGNGYIAETVTYIRGTEQLPSRQLTLMGTLRSRQRYENQQIVRQDILAERTQLTTGDNPPTVEINLPETVKISERYNFDAIVKEPLRNDLLLGYAVEEPVRVDGYLTPYAVKLEPLTAGGIFKVGQAPANEDSRWISAVVVRKDGLTMVTQRLRVVGSNP